MARLPRLCAPAWPHLIVQRARNASAFVEDADVESFLDAMWNAAGQCGVLIHAYGLQNAEARLLATPQTTQSLSGMMQGIGRRYVASFNRRHGQAGGLWEGRFKATVIDPERHLLDAMLFVEESAVGMIDVRTRWSSALHHLGLQCDALIRSHPEYWRLGNTPFERELTYEKRCAAGLPAEIRQLLSIAVRTGWPLGSPEFLVTLGEETERRLAPLPRGRPRAANSD